MRSRTHNSRRGHLNYADRQRTCPSWIWQRPVRIRPAPFTTRSCTSRLLLSAAHSGTSMALPRMHRLTRNTSCKGTIDSFLEETLTAFVFHSYVLSPNKGEAFKHTVLGDCSSLVCHLNTGNAGYERDIYGTNHRCGQGAETTMEAYTWPDW